MVIIARAAGIWKRSLLSVGCIALGLINQMAAAQDYPNKPIHVYMGYPAGTALDIVTRHYATRLQQLSGRPVVVENKPGANTMISMEAVGRSKPDGYTILFGPGASAASIEFKTLAFDPIKDFIPLGGVVAFPFILVISPQITPANSPQELAAILKKRDKVSYGTSNSLASLGGAIFSKAGNLNAQPVPYRAAVDAIREMVAGNIDFIFTDAALALGPIKEGRIKPLAITFVKRATTFPDIPTMQELGFSGFDFHGWMGSYVPAGTPPDVVAKLKSWISEIAKSEETAAFLKQIGGEPFALSGEEYAQWEQKEFANWIERAKVAKIPAN